MSTTIKNDRQFNALDDLDIDELLAKLTPEEIEELNNDVDPDNTLLPPSHRCKYQTTKEPTGDYNRTKLLRFLEDKAKNEKDWDQNKIFIHEEKGKKFIPKISESKISKKELEEMGFEEDLCDNEFDDALKNATEEELVDLAAILGFTGILTQEQVNAASLNQEQSYGGFNTVTKAEKMKAFEALSENTIDIEEMIKDVADNKSTLEELNLNNIKNLSKEQYERMCEALNGNSNLKKIHCANNAITNSIAELFVTMLSTNNTLESINLESNFMTGEAIIKLLEAIVNNAGSNLREFRVCNQRQSVLGVQVEMEIIKLILKNDLLTCVSANFETADAKIKVRDHTARNFDRITRQKRINSDVDK